MNNILIVTSSGKNKKMFNDLLIEQGIENIDSVCDSIQARSLASDNDYNIIIIDSPIGDELGDNLAKNLSTLTASSIILLVNENIEDKMCKRVEGFGIFVLKKPLNRSLFCASLKMAYAARERILALKKENEELHDKINEIRLIDRAKCILIEYLGLNEKQAHRYIEKQAMDLRKTRGDIAMDILNTYEI